MNISRDKVALPSENTVTILGNGRLAILRSSLRKLRSDETAFHLAATFLTTLAIFAIFLGQGIIIARILGPLGRGEFGTAIYFPRDILLYAGLLGAIEMVAGIAARQTCQPALLRDSAAKLGLVTGSLTAIVAAILSIVLLVATQKSYLIPYCLVVCLFVPWEHVQLTVAAVDRGSGKFARYNINRLIFAASFPVLVIVAYLLRVPELLGISWLWMVCLLFVLSKVVGLLPTLRGMNLLPRLANWATRNNESNEHAESQGRAPSVRSLLTQGKPYAVSMFVTEMFDRLDVFLFVALASVTESGYYFVAVPAAAMLIIAPNALGVFTFNAGADKQKSVTMRQASTVFAITALFQIVATILFALIIEKLILLFYGNDFAEAIPFALWLLPASAIKGFLQAADGYLKGREKPMIGVWARGLSIFVMLAFVALMFNSKGLIAIPMAACLGQSIAGIIIVAAIYLDVRNQAQLRLKGSV